jgi:hypothetical protein
MTKYAKRGFFTVLAGREWRREHRCGEYGYCGQTVRSVDDKYTMRFSLTYDLNATVELLDRDMVWRLACRYRCRNVDDFDPSSGFVRSGNGSRLGK